MGKFVTKKDDDGTGVDPRGIDLDKVNQLNGLLAGSTYETTMMLLAAIVATIAVQYDVPVPALVNDLQDLAYFYKKNLNLTFHNPTRQ